MMHMGMMHMIPDVEYSEDDAEDTTQLDLFSVDGVDPN